MQDTELYRQLLGLNTPWTVTRVELKIKEERVEVWAGHAESARWPCPECATELALYDHGEEYPALTAQGECSMFGTFTPRRRHVLFPVLWSTQLTKEGIAIKDS
jgi:hypothetical protein